MSSRAGDRLDDTLSCSVTTLMQVFRDALTALLPTAERLLLTWRDEDQHRDWERLAETLFDVCVRGPIDADAGRRDGEYALPRFDIDHPSYATNSWIGVAANGVDGPTALIRFISGTEPFDSVQVAVLDPAALTPSRRVILRFDELKFVLVRRSNGQPDDTVVRIDAIE